MFRFAEGRASEAPSTFSRPPGSQFGRLVACRRRPIADVDGPDREGYFDSPGIVAFMLMLDEGLRIANRQPVHGFPAKGRKDSGAPTRIQRGASGGQPMVLPASQAPRFNGFDSRPPEWPAVIAACVCTPPNSVSQKQMDTRSDPCTVLRSKP